MFLVQEGWLKPDERTLSPSAKQQMAVNELRDIAGRLKHELGMPVLTVQLNHVRGVYAQRIDLARGRMALIVGERQASLVPWRSALERFAGREVEGALRGQGMSWSLARGMGLGIGMG